MPDTPRPPRTLRALIGGCLPREDRRTVLEELDELYSDRVARTSRLSASAWYARQAVGFVGRVATMRVAEAFGSPESYGTDARLALRYFRRRPSYALTVVLTLGVGTAALVTVYTAAEWVLLRPVPGVGREDALMTLRLGSTVAPPHVSWAVSHPDLLTLRERLPVGGQLAGRSPIDVDLRPPGGDARRVGGELVTSNYFDLLQHRLAAGRGFVADEERLGSPSTVVVLSHALARALYGEAERAIGAPVRLNSTSFQVIGVAGPGFRGADLPGVADLWLPLGALAQVDTVVAADLAQPGILPVWRRMIVRPTPDQTAEQMAAAANAVMEAIRRERQTNSVGVGHYTFLATPGIGLDPAIHASVTRTLGIVAAAALFLLCLAIANLVNLALMESTTRTTTMAVRAALGSSRARMLRALTVEVALLALGGTAVAIMLASLWSHWFQDTQLAEHGGSLAGMHVGGGVILLTVLAITAAAAGALVWPAGMRRAQTLDTLLRKGRGSDPSRQHLRMALVGVQVALTVLLLVSAGLLTGTVANLRRIDLGFSPDRLLVFSVDPHLHGYEGSRIDQLARELDTRLAAQPGVRAVGFVSPAPLRSSYVTGSLYPTADPDATPTIGAGYYISPGFLPALGATVLAGDRAWDAQKGTVVLTEGALAQLFPGVSPQEAIGRVVPTRPRGGWPVRIAAVIADVRLSDVTSDPPPSFFRPLAERPVGFSSMSGFAATPGAPMALTPAVHRVLREAAPELPVFDVRTGRAAVDLQFAEVRAMALVARTLSVIGILLAAIGLYGVLANAVASRRREIGIRAALGATPGGLLARVLLTGALPVACGIVVGSAGAAAAGRLLAQHLFGVAPLEPGVHLAAIATVTVITAAACALPAHRASQVSPASVLREE
jgi:putative ABC transport system permease protein